MNLPSLPDLQQKFAARAGEWASIVKSQDTAGFTRKMSALRARLERLKL